MLIQNLVLFGPVLREVYTVFPLILTMSLWSRYDCNPNFIVKATVRPDD